MWNSNKSIGQLLHERVSTYIEELRNTPDPWTKEDQEGIHDSDACPLCPQCLTPVSVDQHFCPECNASVGDFNNLMPFERIFAQGEVLRNGVAREAHLTPFRIISFGLIGLLLLGPFVPIYWFRLYRNWSDQRSHTIQ